MGLPVLLPGQCDPVPSSNPKVMELRLIVDTIATSGLRACVLDSWERFLTDLVNEEAHDLERHFWRTPCR